MASPLSQDFFTLFGLPTAYDIDGDELSRSYRELQHVAHPDRHSQATDQERRLSMQLASHINEAYQTLRDPVARARYLLELWGMDLNAHNAAGTDMAFLSEQMTLRETLAGLRAGQGPREQLEALLVDIATRLQNLQAALRQQLACAQGPLQEARGTYDKMRFLQRLQDEALDLAEELG